MAWSWVSPLCTTIRYAPISRLRAATRNWGVP